MSVLASALTEAMTSSRHELVILDHETGTWMPHPWQQVHLRAENIAERILDAGLTGVVGLVGEPTVEFVAAIQGVWLAGRSLSILPGPVRGANSNQWARSTLDRFESIGVGIVLSNGAQLEQLSNVETPLQIIDLTQVGHAKKSTPFAAVAAPTGIPAVLQGTAGSTGMPRTAQLSPDAVVNNVRGLIAHLQIDSAEDIGCSWLPTYHDMGLVFLLTAALSGSPIWLAPTSAFAASPFRWLSWLSESQATMTAAPNFAYTVIGKYARRAPNVDLSRVRFALNGGEPVNCVGFERFASELAKFGFDAKAGAPAYGLAESTCAVAAPPPGTGLRYDEVAPADGTTTPRRYALLGQPIPGMEVRVTRTGELYNAVTGREVGEVEIRGTSLMTGYFGEAPLTSEDWFKTGDLGYFVDGSLVVCGRTKEIISVAGRNVFPTEIEGVVAQVRGIREGAVVAVGNDSDASRPRLVIAAEFVGRDEASARRELMQRVAAECGVVPSDVVFMAPGSLPRTSSGKLRRVDVRKQLKLERPSW